MKTDSVVGRAFLGIGTAWLAFVWIAIMPHSSPDCLPGLGIVIAAVLSIPSVILAAMGLLFLGRHRREMGMPHDTTLLGCSYVLFAALGILAVAYVWFLVSSGR